MFGFVVDKVNNFQMLDINSLEPIYGFDGVTVETSVEPHSMSQEVINLNHEASFSMEMQDCSSLFNFVTDLNDKPFYVEYYIPILVQARWHKKPRTNKKWLKRYGMKKDRVLVRCDANSISRNNSYNPCGSIESNEFNIELSNMQYRFRPDQLRRNLKIERCYI